MVIGALRRYLSPREEWPQARVPAGTRVYAIGDIHGRADLLLKLLVEIRCDAEAAPDARKVAVFIGDYVDRGLQSRQVIDIMLDDPLPGFEVHRLRGNHDAWLLRFLEEVEDAAAWLDYGGKATLYSYDVGPEGGPASAEGAGAEAETERQGGAEAIRARHLRMQQGLRAALPPSHLAFLQGLETQHREGDYLFVHAGIRPGVPLEAQSEDDLLWIREPFLDSAADHGVVVVHGHTPGEAPVVRGNRIAIDTAAFVSGHLTCLVLSGEEPRFLST